MWFVVFILHDHLSDFVYITGSFSTINPKK